MVSVTVLGPTGLLSAHSKNVGVYCVRCSRSTCVYLCILRYSTNSHSWVLYFLSSQNLKISATSWLYR